MYDPEHDGTYLSTSLGVHEHWDRNVSMFSSDRYSGLSGNGIDYRPYGGEDVHPAVVITNPQEKHLYVFGTDKGAFPVSLVIGKINVEAQVNGEAGFVEKVEFYLDDHVKATDTEEPYSWSWNQLSFFRHTVKIIAYYGIGNSSSSQLTIWKIL